MFAIAKCRLLPQSEQYTLLENFPLFCPKCKQETLINVRQLRKH
ncbi:MAG: hypothetical protein HFF93_10520 [Oscillibacter sp.]|nr:hypothetical protein [Oscillibacter sp.]MCI9462195.1 hypothetical protein [Oscillibacter sp.]